MRMTTGEFTGVVATISRHVDGWCGRHRSCPRDEAGIETSIDSQPNAAEDDGDGL
jgi:hypothetical protein